MIFFKFNNNNNNYIIIYTTTNTAPMPSNEPTPIEWNGSNDIDPKELINYVLYALQYNGLIFMVCVLYFYFWEKFYVK